MDQQNQLLDLIKAKGFKTTKFRTAIVRILQSAKSPISIGEIEEEFKRQHLSANKTTIYREIAFLIAQDIGREIDFGEGKKRYEISSETHHHHLICIKCRKVEDVDLTQDLSKEENIISKQKGYQILSHSLEFFGICKKCQKIL